MLTCNECGKDRSGKNRGAHGLCGACNARRMRRENPEIFRQRDQARWAARRERENERRKRYYEAHREAHLAKGREYNRTHAEQIRAQQKEYYERVKEQRLARDKEYKKRRRDHFRVLALARHKRWIARKPREEALEFWRRHSQMRVARKNNLAATLTHADWQAILDGFNHCCVYCNRHMQRLTQDHIIPVIKGGPYTPDNIVPACLSCNSRKNARSADEYLLGMPHHR